MKIRLAIVLTLLSIPVFAAAQQPASVSLPAHVRSSAAYAELLLRTTEVRAELESAAADHTEASYKIIDLKYELETLEKAAVRLASVRAADSSRLSLALGKLLVRKASLDADLSRLLRSYKSEHPDVRRAVRKIEIFESAIREVLP